MKWVKCERKSEDDETISKYIDEHILMLLTLILIIKTYLTLAYDKIFSPSYLRESNQLSKPKQG